MNQPERQFQFQILDDSWSWCLITLEESIELDLEYNDSDSGFDGLTVPSKKTVYITEGVDLRTIILHELTHVHLSYQNIGSSDLSVDQYEELVCEWISHNIDKVVNQASRLVKQYELLSK